MTALNDAAVGERPSSPSPSSSVSCEYARRGQPACGSTTGLVRVFVGLRCREHTVYGAEIYEVIRTGPPRLTGPGLVVADDGTLRAPGTGQRAAASTPPALPDPARPGAAAHLNAVGAEAQAAALVMGRTGKPRRRLLERIAELGEHGMTSWEAWTWYRKTHGPIDLYSLRPRLTELKRDGWLVDSGRVRHPRGDNAQGAPAEEVLVLSDRGRRQLATHGGAR